MARIVVTGIGVVSPLGTGRTALWEAAAAGRSGAGPITLFDPAAHQVHIACQAQGYDPVDFVAQKEARRMDRHQVMAIAAASLAIEDSGYRIGDGADEGAIVASAFGGILALEDHLATLLERGPSRMSPFATPSVVPNLAAGYIAMRLGLHGPVMSLSSACASGGDALGIAADTIRRGDATMMLAGAADAPITPYVIDGFDIVGVLSRRNDDPVGAARPFSADRDGFLLGEAAIVFVLEEREAAITRGARILCEVAGHGASADAHHITDPDPRGLPQAAAVRAAIAEARLVPEQIGYVNAHGGASVVGDPREATVLREVFGAHAPKLAVSSTKPLHGHCMGAAGALEAAICAMAVSEGVLPATGNLAEVDPECAGLGHIIGEPRRQQVAAALSVNYGLGGHNSAVVLTRGD